MSPKQKVCKNINDYYKTNKRYSPQKHIEHLYKNSNNKLYFYSKFIEREIETVLVELNINIDNKDKLLLITNFTKSLGF